MSELISEVMREFTLRIEGGRQDGELVPLAQEILADIQARPGVSIAEVTSLADDPTTCVFWIRRAES